MASAQLPGLKRLREPSPPPSPSSSSPKRAMSEDMVPASVGDNINGESSGMLQPTSGLSSSPLKADNYTSEESQPSTNTTSAGDSEDGGEWVKRTEDFHLSEAVQPSNPHLEHYNQILSELPPPFVPWSIYYLVPSSLINQIKSLALDTSNESTASEAIKLDISALIPADGETTEPTQDPSGYPADTGKSGDEVSVPKLVTDPGNPAALACRVESISPEKLWTVRPGLVEDEDFKFVSEQTWRALIEWYGPYDGPSLPRFCVPPDRIEMIPPVFTLYLVDPKLNSDPASADTHVSPLRITLPSAAPIFALRSMAVKLYSPTDHMTGGSRLWSVDASLATANNDEAVLAALKQRHVSPAFVSALAGKQVLMKASETLASSGIENGDTFVLEYATAAGKWTCQTTPQGNAPDIGVSMPPVPQAPPPLFSMPALFSGNGHSSSNAEASGSRLEPPAARGVSTRSQSQRESKRIKGLVGLQNLGNTCFMNSAVQCLSNTIELNDYFLSGVYRDELNPDNPLGMGGAVAKAFGDVIENLWSNASSYFSPRQFKYVTSRFAPQFAGYGQHDTQEFIAFLLDGLHEDLNRIKKKPYIEKPDWKAGGGAKELAELGKECWDGYRKRNDSVIVDLFQGQLQSTLICPECHKESITMDPFMYLTVPMPIAQHRRIKLRYVPRDTEQSVKQVTMLVPQNASFGQVKEKLGRLMSCDPANLVMFDQWKSSVYAWLTDPDHNGEAKDSDDILVHDVGAAVSSTRRSTGCVETSDSVTVPVYSFRGSERHGHSRHDYPADNALQPFFITLTKAEASDPVAVREAITKGYVRLVCERAKPYLWASQGSKSAASALPQFGAEEDESPPVTEIHLDGETATVPETEATSTDAMDVDGSADASASPVAASPMSLPPPSAGSGKLVPRGDLFKVHIAEAYSAESYSSLNPFKSKDKVIPFWKGAITSASAHWSLLEHRKKARRNMLNRLTSGINSIVNSSYASDDDTASPPATPKEPPLVVKPGEGVFVEWPAKTFAEFFENNDYHSAAPRFTEEEVFVDPAIAKEDAKRKEGKAISIEDCLDEFSKEETLGQEDLWYCPVCKKHQAATKKLEIYKAPDILVICIKRFGSSRRLSDKLDNLVNFPLEGLDLEDRIGERRVAKTLNLSDVDAEKYGIESTGEEYLYDLYAVDNHFGGLGGGHYTAFCRNRADHEWYNYDDSRVSRADANSVQSRAAYLLFYRRRAARPIGGLSRIKAEEASRAASRVPSRTATPEPDAGPSTYSEAGPSRRDSDDSSLLDAASPRLQPVQADRELLPDYSSAASEPSTPTSPTASDADMPAEDSDVEASNRRLGEKSLSLGFGNANWTTTTKEASSAQQPALGLKPYFGSATASADQPAGLATPESLDGDENDKPSAGSSA